MNNNLRYEPEIGINKNSRKILYVSVAVAALFIAVISGTFAYFQASATNTTSISGQISNTGLTLTVVKDTKNSSGGAVSAPNGVDLIPFDTDNTYDTLVGNGDSRNPLNGSDAGATMLNRALSNSCIDSNGYTSCHVYRISVISAANSPRIPITGTVQIFADNAPNINYTLISAQTTTNDTTVSAITSTATNTTAISSLVSTDTYYNAKTNVKSGQPLEFTAIERNVNAYLPAANGNNRCFNYYLVVWVEDNGCVQNQKSATANDYYDYDSDCAADTTHADQYRGDFGGYTGTVTFNSASGNITATFSS